jgi:hypothetical protein
MSGHSTRPQSPHGIPDGIVAKLVKRIDELSELLDVQSAVIDGLAERIAALEARGPKSRRNDEIGEGTRRVLAFLDSIAPVKVTPIVIAVNLGHENSNDVASSLAVLDRRGLIAVRRQEGKTALYGSKHTAPPQPAPTTETEPKT